MTKKAILTRKLFRTYNNKLENELSVKNGYPVGTYYGYKSFRELRINKVNQFVTFYGKGLRHCKFKNI